MRKRFPKHESGYIIWFNLLFLPIPIILIATLWFIDPRLYSAIILYGAIALLSLLVVLPKIGYKNSLSKVLLSEDGIKIILFTKTREFVKWNEIIEINKAKRSINVQLVTNNTIIVLQVNKRMYKSIMAIAPEDIRQKIDALNLTKHYGTRSKSPKLTQE